MEWALLPLKRYFQLSGRARRREYWSFFLFSVIVSAVLGFIDELLGLKLPGTEGFGDNGVLGGLFSLVTLVPSITVAVRRLHDTDRSGWWLWLPVGVIVVAIIGLVGVAAGDDGGTGLGIGVWVMIALGLGSFGVLLVFLCLDGTRGPNRFGDDPKGVAYEGVFD